MNRQPWIRKTTGALLCAGTVALVGCNSNQSSAPVAPAVSSTAIAPATAGSSAQASAPYTPPSADQLYQMVAPIALFPDKLIAQVLAGSTYPDQITSADNVLTKNPNLRGADLQTAIVQQSWDPSVKGLTAFPSVLDQMAGNISWTTALGEAYVNDPTDVMNAIQVMRQRASQHGNLRSSAQMNVVTQAEPAQPTSEDGSDDNQVYNGPAVVPAPQQIIEIEPAQPDTVYVPQYDAQTVYGEEVPYYPGYTYERPREYSTGQIVTVGAISFGVGVLVAKLFEHHHDEARSNYGWQSWGMNWGGRGRDENRGGDKSRGWQRPTVIHNNNTYISRSTTVVNHYVTNNNQHNTTVNNRHNDNHSTAAPQPSAMRPAEAHPAIAHHASVPVEHKPMSMPNFGKYDRHASAPHGTAITPRPSEISASKRATAPNPGEHKPVNTHSPHATPAPVEHAHPVMHPTSAPVAHREAPVHSVESHVMPHTRPAPRPEPARPAAHEPSQPVQHASTRATSHPQVQRKAEPPKKDEKKKDKQH